jgi:hypothetical protein
MAEKNPESSKKATMSGLFYSLKENLSFPSRGGIRWGDQLLIILI